MNCDEWAICLAECLTSKMPESISDFILKRAHAKKIKRGKTGGKQCEQGRGREREWIGVGRNIQRK